MAGAVVTTVGKGLIAAVMLSQSVAKYLQHGTGTGAPAAGDTALGTASADPVVAGTQSNPTAPVYRVTGSVVAASPQPAITEVGLFATATPTSLLYRETFTALSVRPYDRITYTIDITVT